MFSEKSRLHQNAYHLLYRIYLSIRASNVRHINNHIMPSSNNMPSYTFLSASRRHCYGTNILIIFGNKACYQATINARLAYASKVFEWEKQTRITETHSPSAKCTEDSLSNKIFNNIINFS